MSVDACIIIDHIHSFNRNVRARAICGVYCGQCPNGNGRVKYAAGELKRLVDTTRYGWLEEVVDSFSFEEFRKGLEWFASNRCPSCLNMEEAHC